MCGHIVAHTDGLVGEAFVIQDQMTKHNFTIIATLKCAQAEIFI